ncbi:MAG: enoyl-CoA hydratase-related protein [Acidimicrobiales bacterium]
MDFGSSWLLRRRVRGEPGEGSPSTARMVDAAEARELGLVNTVVPADELDAATNEVVATIAGGPPIALAMTAGRSTTPVACRCSPGPRDRGAGAGVNVHTDDMLEAMMAWVERRTPEFRGR